ncbi:hypothetical protein WA026_018258 [Henosepilachna vigintioctopunctata]|uniref:Uncharacterized protein n=1 Tax=Henosepilachna vigintioctopunctata TaxID=420089 RepID=A0AAW1VF61_9CUCU
MFQIKFSALTMSEKTHITYFPLKSGGIILLNCSRNYSIPLSFFFRKTCLISTFNAINIEIHFCSLLGKNQIPQYCVSFNTNLVFKKSNTMNNRAFKKCYKLLELESLLTVPKRLF